MPPSGKNTYQLNISTEAVKEFRRLNPPKFDGASSDLKEANHWLYESHQQGN